MGTSPALASEFSELIRLHRLPQPTYVTRPTMPDFDTYAESLRGIWDRKWLTNQGPLHDQLERRLCEFLQVDHLSVFCNGTIALLVALEALRINSGEVITTPFSFPATAHSLYWNRVKPVFCDIDPLTFNLDPSKIEHLISPETRAILAVHVYGTPCAVEPIERIAHAHGLHVIYDAAHAFGVGYKGRSILDYGDISILSFHATKLFTTIEGGALISGSRERQARVNSLKNFGIADEETVIGPGINGKMNEFQAAFGLLQLEMVEREIALRGKLNGLYRKQLSGVPGIHIPAQIEHAVPNFAYFPILIDEARFGMGRDALHALLKDCNVIARKYFYPLITAASCYSSLPSAASGHLPVAERVSRQVLCLPVYGTLDPAYVKAICHIIREAHELVSSPRHLPALVE